ncbi:MAG: hypothetical protein NZZ41_02930 [Candidatus Dojkabacteria bacterium]|nr:hypothetical protein [Candidatus Dojkabacteria bacterium]
MSKIIESKFEPKNKNLWEKSKRMAKKDLKYIPAQCVNAWAAKKYKEMGGEWRIISSKKQKN